MIPAHAHAVFLPTTPGLSRGSQVFFFAPPPNTDIKPPIPFKHAQHSLSEDDGVVPPEIGLSNWDPSMKYKDWSEAIVKGFKKSLLGEI